MYAVNARAGRVTLGVVLAALAACGDEPPPTAPITVPPPQFAAGDVYTVTNTQDAGIGSLRWALSFSTGEEIIRFDPSLAGHTITLDSSVYIRKSVTIEGPANGGITIKGTGFDDRLFWARFNGTVTLRNLSLTGAYTSGGVGSVIYAFIKKKRVADNPWGEGATTLEWTLSSPPPFHQYEKLPVIK